MAADIFPPTELVFRHHGVSSIPLLAKLYKQVKPPSFIRNPTRKIIQSLRFNHKQNPRFEFSGYSIINKTYIDRS